MNLRLLSQKVVYLHPYNKVTIFAYDAFYDVSADDSPLSAARNIFAVVKRSLCSSEPCFHYGQYAVV